MPRSRPLRRWWTRFLLRFVHAVSWIVPRGRRKALRGEWRAEILHTVSRGGRGQGGPGAVRVGLSGGAAAGLVLALQVGRLLESRLAGVGATDLVTFAGATAALLVAATAASLVPALRSARVDPVDGLSSE